MEAAVLVTLRSLRENDPGPCSAVPCRAGHCHAVQESGVARTDN